MCISWSALLGQSSRVIRENEQKWFLETGRAHCPFDAGLALGNTLESGFNGCSDRLKLLRFFSSDQVAGSNSLSDSQAFIGERERASHEATDNVSAANFDAISHAVNSTSYAKRFARVASSEDNTSLYISFRGTSSAVDVLKNMESLKTCWEPSEDSARGSAGLCACFDSCFRKKTKPMVHSGWYRAYMALLPLYQVSMQVVIRQATSRPFLMGREWNARV